MIPQPKRKGFLRQWGNILERSLTCAAKDIPGYGLTWLTAVCLAPSTVNISTSSFLVLEVSGFPWKKMDWLFRACPTPGAISHTVFKSVNRTEVGW